MNPFPVLILQNKENAEWKSSTTKKCKQKNALFHCTLRALFTRFFDSLFDCYIHLTTFVLDYCSFPSWYLSLENAIYIRFLNGNYKSKITLFLVHFYGMLCVALRCSAPFCCILFIFHQLWKVLVVSQDQYRPNSFIEAINDCIHTSFIAFNGAEIVWINYKSWRYN